MLSGFSVDFFQPSSDVPSKMVTKPSASGFLSAARSEAAIKKKHEKTANFFISRASMGRKLEGLLRLTLPQSGATVNWCTSQIHRKHEPPLPAYAFVAYACHWQAVGA